MSVQNNIAGSESVVLERPAAGGVYASLFEKINLSPVSELSALDLWQDAQAMSDATADERLTAGMQVFLECLTKAGAKVEKLDKSLIDHHIAELDYQISRQLDAVMHHDEFQAVESLWRGVKSLVDKTDFRQNVKIELLSMSKEDLRQDFEDSPEIIQSGLYKHAYIDEYDTPGGEPIAALISAYEFDASAQDVALLRNISKVSADLNPAPESGAFYARIRHERYLNGQTQTRAITSSPALSPGMLLKVTGGYEVADVFAQGVVITAMQTHARRDEDFSLRFDGIPDSPDFSFRPEPGSRPVMAGTLPARVTSTTENDTYGHIDKDGR